MIRRRELIGLLGGAVARPVAARAQQRAMPTIGLLVAGTFSSHGQWVSAFERRLRELGWIEGRTLR
jgi:putative ABC transport system substrate-binding protein